MRDPNEGRLLERCRQGEADAWDELLARHYAPAYRFVFQLGFRITHEDAEEICQEAFLSVIRSLDSFNGRSAFQTWLFRIAANKARDVLEKQSAAKRGGGQVPLSLDTEDPDTGLKLDPANPDPAPDSEMAEEERFDLVHESVARLDTPCRELIELRYFGDLSYEELAASLRLHPKTVSSRLSRCLDRLEDLVKEAFAREEAGVFSV
jgi:RNA polymerase sigma-70 factor (ECF subfamily)